ncbi:MAG TPA: TIGR03118 family protein, partial [Actinomycetota bacterium]|nr:TIGR03118 family protein [Actinomycetota bacterium]
MGIAALAAVMIGLAGAAPVWAALAGQSKGGDGGAVGTKVHQTNLVSDLSTVGASIVDPNLKNPWGLALSPSSPLWVANNGTATATLYSIGPGGATVTAAPLVVGIPGGDPATGVSPAPTGQVFNPTSSFGGAR